LHCHVLLNFPIAKTPNNAAEPTLLAALIFDTCVDLQFGHFIAVEIGRPQFGQLSASDDICLVQSGQEINGIA